MVSEDSFCGFFFFFFVCAWNLSEENENHKCSYFETLEVICILKASRRLIRINKNMNEHITVWIKSDLRQNENRLVID